MASTTKNGKLRASKVQKLIANNAILFIWLLFFVVSLITIKGFASLYNIKSYLVNCAVLLIAAIGLTFPTLNGGIDFSMTSVIDLVSTISAYIMVLTSLKGSVWAIPVAIVVSLAIGAAVGAINGLAVSRLKMPSFVATLSTMMIISGIAVWFGNRHYEKVSLSGLPDGFTVLNGKGALWFLPVVIAAGIFLYCHWLLTRTLFGRRIYSVGVNPRTSEISGIPVKKVVFSLSLISGVMASMAGILYTAKNGAGIVTLGDDMFINFVGSVVIGGTSPMGGSGGVKQTLYGVLFVMLISNILNLLGVNYTMYDVVKGVFILLAAGLELVTRRMNEKAAVLASKEAG